MNNPNPSTYYYLFQKMSKDEVKAWLKDYALNPTSQTISFQALARIASCALEEVPLSQADPSYTKTKYGIELYFHMIGLN